VRKRQRAIVAANAAVFSFRFLVFSSLAADGHPAETSKLHASKQLTHPPIEDFYLFAPQGLARIFQEALDHLLDKVFHIVYINTNVTVFMHRSASALACLAGDCLPQIHDCGWSTTAELGTQYSGTGYSCALREKNALGALVTRIHPDAQMCATVRMRRAFLT
jgi:hypothetical protein